jgi:hypothetical protein
MNACGGNAGNWQLNQIGSVTETIEASHAPPPKAKEQTEIHAASHDKETVVP